MTTNNDKENITYRKYACSPLLRVALRKRLSKH